MVGDRRRRTLAGVLEGTNKLASTQIELLSDVYDRPAAELKEDCRRFGAGAGIGPLDYAGFEDKIDYAKHLGLKYMGARCCRRIEGVDCGV